MATTNIVQFSMGIDRFGEKSEAQFKRRVKGVAMEGVKGLVKGTRVDTGRARGNWQVGESTPPEGEVDTTDPTGSATIAEGTRKVLAMSGEEVIWLHNGVPYIEILEQKDKMLVGTVERLRTWIRST